MKSSIIKIFLLLLLMPLISHSQNFYEFKWETKGIEHIGFLIYNNDSNMTMRVGYTTKTGIYKVVEYKCVRKEYTNENGKKVIKYDGVSDNNRAKIIYQSGTHMYGYVPDNFYFIDVDENNNYKNLYVNDDQEQTITVTEVNYKKLNINTDLTKSYLNQFYSKNDNTYKKIINKKPIINKPISHLVTKITFIAIGDTNDPELSKPIIHDIEKYNRFFKIASKNLKIPYKSFVFKGDDFTKSKAINQINNISISNNEVVILLYRGHGFRWADQSSDFPRMKLGDSFNQESYNFETLHNNIKNKNPRLLISIGDMCNNIEGLTPIVSTSSDPISQDYSSNKLDIKKMSELLSKKGNILTVSAKPGEKSYSSYDYGYYSKSLMDALVWEISEFNEKSYASWTFILDDASKKARKTSLSKANTYQNALTKINLN